LRQGILGYQRRSSDRRSTRWQEESTKRGALNWAAQAGTVGEDQGREEMGLVTVKRNLRVTKWLSSTPAVGVCTTCSKEFKVPLTALTKTKDAQVNLQRQFDQHECDVIPS
jgi:hypothetical protein